MGGGGAGGGGSHSSFPLVWPSQGRIQDLGARGKGWRGGTRLPLQAGSGAEPQPLCNFRTFKVTKHSIIA